MPNQMIVEYMSHGGDDLLVVNAARCSFGKESKLELTILEAMEEAEEFAEKNKGSVDYYHIASDRWFGGYPVQHLAAKDIKLLNYLAKEGHWLPFRHPSLTLRCKAPMFVARQLGKHQTGFSWSEESRRYVKTAPEFYWPEKWRKAAENVKQGSSDEAVDCNMTKSTMNACQVSLWQYQYMLDMGVAPEQARMILPQNLLITWVWTGTLLAWMNMLKARLASDAQAETREFARLIAQHVQERFPHSYEALMNVSPS